MNANSTLNNPLNRQFSFCSRVGGISGAIVGLIFGLIQLHLEPAVVFTVVELLVIGLLLGFIAWLCVLVIAGVWLHYGVAAIALLVLIISLVIGIVTVVTLNMIGFPPLGMLLGLFIGTLLGALICWILCNKRHKPSSLANQGGESDANR